MESEYYDCHVWDVIRANYLETDGCELISHLLDSYNDFVSIKIEQIIEGFNVIEVPYKYNAAREIFEYKLFVSIKNVTMNRPIIYEKDGCTSVMTPNMARVRNLTYSSNLYADVHVCGIWYDDGHMKEGKKVLQNVNLGKIPVMVNSDYCVLKNPEFRDAQDNCKFDYGGYFIINGNEKVVVSQDRISENKVYVFVDSKLSMYSHIAEIRSVPDNMFGAPKLTSIKLTAKTNQYGRCIRVNLHHVRNEVPIVILMRALGVESDLDIVSHVVLGDAANMTDTETWIGGQLRGSINEANHVMTTMQALEWLSANLSMSGSPKELLHNHEYRLRVVRDVLRKDFLPHIGEDLSAKAVFIGYMVNKLIRCASGHMPLDDRDSYINKRVDTPGVLMANLYRQYFGKMIKDMKGNIYKEMTSGAWRSTNDFMDIINNSNIYKMVKFTTIETGLKYSLATGNWGLKNANVKQGVAQVLNRLTYKATISHLRRVNTPMEKSGKLIQPRKLHPTQWGVICPSETPEGSSIGLVKNLSITATVTVASPSYSVWHYARVLGTKMEFGPADLAKHAMLLINGAIAGVHSEPATLVTGLKSLKRRAMISVYTSVSWDVARRIITVSTEAGRCVRPLLIVDDGNRVRLTKRNMEQLRSGEISWSDLVCPTVRWGMDDDDGNDQSVIEYLDVAEMNSSMIAMKLADLNRGSKGSLHPIKYQYMEIHPSLILGVTANDIPFPHHNQSPRVTYQSAMGKQAIGIYATNYLNRLDTMAHILNYPQRSLVHTNASDMILNYNDMPSGQNVIVAIATYTGFNQEDSVIVNRSALDRGIFNSTYYRTYKEHCNKNHSTGEEEYFCRPDPDNTRNLKPFNYDKLGDDGFVPENVYVENGDVVIGKCMPQKVEDTFIHKDNSLVIKSNESGYVDKCCANNRYFKNVNADGYTFAKVRIRTMRSPIIGDKLSSRYAQKGTIGMVYVQEDMPFSESGIVPDIIINPHAIPSRMTIGQLMECIMGKACCGVGAFGNGTPFTNLRVEDISKVLMEQCGLEPHGNEILYNGRTGEQMKTSIFMGPTYYQRLKHMVNDKLHCVDKETEVLTRDRGWQPVAEVTIDDYVATLASDGYTLVYERPTECFSYEYTGKMYRVDSSLIDMFVTPNHRMWVSIDNADFGFVRADDLIGISAMYQKDAEWPAEDHQVYLPMCGSSNSVRVMDMASWLSFFGTWVSPYRQASDEELMDRLIRSLRRLGWIDIDTIQHEIMEYMKPYGYGRGGNDAGYRLPDWVWNLSKIQARSLMVSMLQNSSAFRAETKELAGDIMRLALHSGWSGTVIKHDDYTVMITMTHNTNCPVVLPSETAFVNYSGLVYCLSVPSQVFYIRRNGKAAWTGNSRSSSGPIVLLTRQPSEGRARDGGLRLGEMEVECIWAHGAMHYLKERLMECSDNYRMFICRRCCIPANVNPERGVFKCHTCQNTTNFHEIRVPYACKLLFQEIQTMGIGAKFIS